MAVGVPTAAAPKQPPRETQPAVPAASATQNQPSDTPPTSPEKKKPRIQSNVSNAMPLAAKGAVSCRAVLCCVLCLYLDLI